MIDSGPKLFLNGGYYYRHLGQLSLNLSVAKTITDAGWHEYLEGTFALSREFHEAPKVSLVAFIHAHPNAGQRRATAEFVSRNEIPPIERIAVLTDSQLLRGAMVAFSWVMPKSNLRAFKGSEYGTALAWLREVATFDEARAKAAWVEACAQLKVTPR